MGAETLKVGERKFAIKQNATLVSHFLIDACVISRIAIRNIYHFPYL